MKTLIADNDMTSRERLRELLEPFGDVHTASDGREAVDAVIAALYCGSPYDLICLDTMMPDVPVHEVQQQIRQAEQACEIPSRYCSKIIMTSEDLGRGMEAFKLLCDACLIKPLDRQIVLDELRTMNLISR